MYDAGVPFGHRSSYALASRVVIPGVHYSKMEEANHWPSKNSHSEAIIPLYCLLKSITGLRVPHKLPV